MLMNFFTRAVLGTDFRNLPYYSMVSGLWNFGMDWSESVYMSICNRKLTNRGFTHGPICPDLWIWGTDSPFPAASVCRKSWLRFPYYGLHCANFYLNI